MSNNLKRKSPWERKGKEKDKKDQFMEKIKKNLLIGDGCGFPDLQSGFNLLSWDECFEKMFCNNCGL